MRLGIKAKQVLGVTAIVGAVVVALSSWHLASLARVSLEESRARAELVANAIYQRAFEVVGESRDQRQVKLFGTKKGLQLLKGAPRPLIGVLQQALSELPAARLHALHAELAHVIALMKVKSPV